MLTVQVVPGPAAKEASERIMKRFAYCVEKSMCIDMREEMHKVIYEVLLEHDFGDAAYAKD